MSRLSEAFLGEGEHRRPQISPGTYEGRFAKDVTEIDKMATVKISAWSPTSFFGPAPWPTRVDEDGVPVLPSRGDRCLVTISDDEQTWIVAWWPYAS